MEQFVVGHTGQWWELKEAESISRMPQFNYYPRRLYSLALVGTQLLAQLETRRQSFGVRDPVRGLIDGQHGAVTLYTVLGVRSDRFSFCTRPCQS